MKSKQRIPNLPREKWTDDAREVFAFWGEPGAWENGSATNTMMVMATHPKLAMAFNTFGRQVLLDSTLPVRARELATLRVAWHVRSEYEWHYHVGYALKGGITLEEIAAVRAGPDSTVWDGKDLDRAVLSAVDELLKVSTISDETWAALSGVFDERQLMDFVFTIGNYVMYSWAIAAFGIPLEDSVDRIGFDLKTASGSTPDARLRPGETNNNASG